ncbi:MAG: A/G-specific adenine glycosylase [Longimicrobiales bacterium]
MNRRAAALPDPPDEDRVRTMREALLDHYDRTARDLPWRGEDDPYRVWVSEVMLQQTRVDTVLGYYGPWLERFPDVASLAGADLDEVMLAWEGLGYYRRARFLHQAARVVRDRLDGRVPSAYDDLRSLPGLGEYAAGAVASIAFGQAVPAVDGNVRRVFARLFDVADPKAAWLRAMGMALVDPHRPGDWNQALMDLGATVCVPGTPRCDRCPLSAFCAAYVAGTQEERPAPPKRKAVPSGTIAGAVVVDPDGRALFVRRPPDGLLGGMWAFPEVDMDDGADAVGAARDAAEAAGVALGAESGGSPELLPAVRHRFSHLDVTYRPVLLRGAVRRSPHEAAEGAAEGSADRLWASLADPGVALPVAQQRIARAARAALEGD